MNKKTNDMKHSKQGKKITKSSAGNGMDKLKERVKELNCLYGLTKIVKDSKLSIGEALQKIVELLPPSWRYPDVTCTRINLDGREFKTDNFKETKWSQISNIIADNKKIGVLEVYYLKEKPRMDEGPFLIEERRLIDAVSDLIGEFIKERRNVIFLGSSGTGKTHMATALGLEACKNNFRTRFVTCYGLVNELIEAREERELQRLLQRYSRYDLLILDELGYIPFSREGAELLFQVLAERHEKGSVMITTNLGFADWTQVFGEQAMTAALLDRLTHKARIINCIWQSYRLKQSLEYGNRG